MKIEVTSKAKVIWGYQKDGKNNPHTAFRENKVLLTSGFLHFWFLEISASSSHSFPPLFFVFHGSHRKLSKPEECTYCPHSFEREGTMEMFASSLGICLCLLYVTTQHKK